MPEDRNAWSAPNSDKICYSCGKPYTRPPGVGCYLKELHGLNGASRLGENELAEAVARQAESTRAARGASRNGFPRKTDRSSSSSNVPEIEPEIKARNRIEFLRGKIPQLERRLENLERGSGTKWEVEHVRRALDDLRAEFTSLEGSSAPGALSDRQPEPHVESISSSRPTAQAPPRGARPSDTPPLFPKRLGAQNALGPRFRYRHRRWFRWTYVYLLVFLAIFLWHFWGDLTGSMVSQDYTVWGYTLVIWNVSVPIPLLLYSIIAAFVVFIPVRLLGWGAKQIARHRVGRGLSAVIIVFLVVGFAASNSPLQSKIIPSPSQFYSSLSYLQNYSAALNSQTNSVPTQPSGTSTSESQVQTIIESTTNSQIQTATSPAVTTIDAQWVASFFSIVNSQRSTPLTESDTLDQFAALRFNTIVTHFPVTHYGYDQDFQSFFAGQSIFASEEYFYPQGTPSDYAQNIQTTAPVHWQGLLDSTYSHYGYYLGSGPVIEIYQPCSAPLEIIGSVNETQQLQQYGCQFTIVTSTYLVIELSS